MKRLPEADKDAILLRLLRGDEAHLRTGLLRRYHGDPVLSAGAAAGRTAGQLLAAAEDRVREKLAAALRQAEVAGPEPNALSARTEVVTAAAATYPAVLDELVQTAWHYVEQHANNRIEADHSQLKHRLRPMCGPRTDRSAQTVIAGHAFLQNLRRNHYELGLDAPAIDLDEPAADHLSGLLGRSVEPGSACRVKLDELDTALRRSAAGQGLISILEILHGRPVNDRAAVRQDAQAQWAQVWQQLDAMLSEAGLADAAWVPEWIAGLRRTGVLTRAGVNAATRALGHAVAALGILLHPTDERPNGWELAALATEMTAAAHGFDDTSLAAAVLLRAAAQALG